MAFSGNPTVGIVLNTAWNIQNFRLGLIRALLASGAKVVAIAPADEFVPEIEATGCTFVPLKQLARKGVNPFQDLRLAWELAQIYQKNDLDVVLHYTIKPNIYGSMAARWVGIPMISTVTGLGYSFMQEGWVNRIVQQLYRWAFKAKGKVVFQNRDDQQLFIERQLCPAEKTQLIKGSGINTVYFAPQPKKEALDRVVFLFVGRLLYDKGIVELFEAAKLAKAACPEAVFWVVGALDEGNPSALNKAQLEAAQDNGLVKYWGATTDVRSFMCSADVVVLPSYREGLPRVMLESLAMGKPVITTNVAGCRETVKAQENGYLVPAKDSQALAKAMIDLYQKTPEERQAMGAIGRELALAEFDEQVIVQQYQDLIAELVF